MSASLLEEGDAALVVSHSGESKDVILGAEVARASGAKVITITNSIASTLARNSDVVLCAPAKEAPLMGQNAAARIAQLAILDTMFICLAREDYETAERNLNKVLTSVAVYSTNDRGRTERRGTPRADKKLAGRRSAGEGNRKEKGGVMKIRGLLIATVAAAGMLGFSASAMAADYAIVLKTLSNPFWVQMKDGIEAKAKELGVEVDIVASPSEEDFQAQLQLFEDMLNRDYKGFAFAPAVAGQPRQPGRRRLQEGQADRQHRREGRHEGP